jgi:predicted N-acyltransferase
MQVCKGTGNKYAFKVFESLSAIDKEVWDNINLSIPFYQKHAFLSVIENIQRDIQFRYVLIWQEKQVVGALYVQLLSFSFKNLVNYSGDQSNGIKGRIKKYMSQKNARLLNLGDVFFTGDKGIISKNEEPVIPLIPLIFTAINKTFKDKKPSAALVANVYLQDESRCMDFYNNAFHSFTTEPDMFMSVDDNWKSFEGYINSFSSKYRVRAKKVITVSKEIGQKELSLEDIVAQKSALECLYNNVVNHVAFNMATLNVDFFARVKQLYGNQCTIIGYYLNGRLVSFACLFHIDPGTLHVHYIGLDYEVNREYKLYNRMLLDFVKFAIEKGLKSIHFGRTATEIKTTIGAEPRQLNAYLKMNNAMANATLPYFLNRIKPAEYIPRNPFKEQ